MESGAETSETQSQNTVLSSLCTDYINYFVTATDVFKRKIPLIMLTPITLIFIFTSLSEQLTWSHAGESMHALVCTSMWKSELFTG